MKLGHAIHNERVIRKINLTSLGKKIASESVLSRLERDQTMINSQSLFKLMSRLSGGIGELELLFRNSDPDDLYASVLLVIKSGEDEMQQLELYLRQLTKHDSWPYYSLTATLLSAELSNEGSHKQPSSDDVHRAATYLLRLKHPMTYDYLLYSSLTLYFNAEDLTDLSKRVIGWFQQGDDSNLLKREIVVQGMTLAILALIAAGFGAEARKQWQYIKNIDLNSQQLETAIYQKIIILQLNEGRKEQAALEHEWQILLDGVQGTDLSKRVANLYRRFGLKK